MNRRQAKKIVRLAHPSTHDLGQIHKALRVVRRSLRFGDDDPCDDCPGGGCFEGSPRCRYQRRCDDYACAFSLAMAIDGGRHPWGDWVCLMQQAQGIPAGAGSPLVLEVRR
jgi:hypothetical protein